MNLTSAGLEAVMGSGEFFRRNDHISFYDGRARLHLNAYVSDNTMGRIHLETGSDNSQVNYRWGCDSDRDGSGVYAEGNCKKDELRVLEAWIRHDFAGAPMGVKIGHMPIKLGRGLFILHTRLGDDAINPYFKISDNLTAELIAAKFEEGEAGMASDDTDLYTAIVNYTSGTFSIGGDVSYIRDREFGDDDPADALAFSEGLDLWNIGIRGDVDVAGVNIYGDVEFQTGTAENDPSDPANPYDRDMDFGGYAVVAGADFKLGPASLNAEFGMGSGLDEDDFAEDIAAGNDTDFDMFITSQSLIPKPDFTYVYDFRQMTAALDTNTGIANTTYLKVGASMKPAPDLSVSGDVFYLQATEEVLGEDDLGIEIDGRLKYNLDKNLQYFIEAGYLLTGDFYDNFDDEGDADDAYAVRHGIQLAF
jgi:predicted porin